MLGLLQEFHIIALLIYASNESEWQKDFHIQRSHEGISCVIAMVEWGSFVSDIAHRTICVPLTIHADHFPFEYDVPA